MATQKQRQTARRNVKQAQSGARRKRTISNLPSRTRTALGREGAKAAARKRGASRGTGSGAGAMTVTELRREVYAPVHLELELVRPRLHAFDRRDPIADGDVRIEIARANLGVGLDEIRTAFQR